MDFKQIFRDITEFDQIQLLRYKEVNFELIGRSNGKFFRGLQLILVIDIKFCVLESIIYFIQFGGYYICGMLGKFILLKFFL